MYVFIYFIFIDFRLHISTMDGTLLRQILLLMLVSVSLQDDTCTSDDKGACSADNRDDQQTKYSKGDYISQLI